MELSDIDVIEESLRHRMNALSKESTAKFENQDFISDEMKKIQNVLGQLHNQKNWYRPKDSIYVSGWFKSGTTSLYKSFTITIP